MTRTIEIARAYILRGEAYSALQEHFTEGGFKNYTDGQKCMNRIKAIPAADVVKRKVGHWIFHPEQKNIYGGKLIECSECRTQYLVMNVMEETYCRHCGSKNQNGGQDDAG